MNSKDFVVFILSHGRADKVVTFKTLRKSGYTGKVIVLIDDEDDQAGAYFARFGRENVEIFSKTEIAKTFDLGDNFTENRSIVFARNACFGIAERLGYRYFIELDDDYSSFENRRPLEVGGLQVKKTKRLGEVFSLIFDFYAKTPFHALALAQGGDFIGGAKGILAKKMIMKRKAMNVFFLSTDRKFSFVGRVNEDVNTYTSVQARGDAIMGTLPFVSITQKQTQKQSGGMTELYRQSGTYVKSFYSVMFAPSCVKVRMMTAKHARIHHSIAWRYAVPKFISEDHKKK